MPRIVPRDPDQGSIKMKITLAFASAVTLLAAAAHAETPAQRILYNVDAAAQCSAAANATGHLQQGMEFCDTALRDPLMTYRGAVLVDRGVIKVKLNDVNGALADYNAALVINPEMGDAYVSRSGAYIALKRNDEALADTARGIQLGAANLAVAYFNRGIVEDDQGNYQAAYRDYKQAVALKPDYTLRQAASWHALR